MLEVVAQNDGVLSKIVKQVDDTVLSDEVIGELSEGATSEKSSDDAAADNKQAQEKSSDSHQIKAPLYHQSR